MPRYEVAIIKTNDDGKREAVVLHTMPSKDSGPGDFGVGFLYRYLRESRRKDAPPGFTFGVISRKRVEELWEKANP